MTLSTIEVISVPVSDQDASRKFYSETLGFTIDMDAAFGDGTMRWVMLRPPGGGTAITLMDWFDTMVPGSQRGTVLGCDDIERTAASLKARGVTFHEDAIEEAPWGRWLTFDDPDGNAWVLQQTSLEFRG